MTDKRMIKTKKDWYTKVEYRGIEDLEERATGKRKKRESLCERNRSNRKGDKRVKNDEYTRERTKRWQRQTEDDFFILSNYSSDWNIFQEKIQGKILAKDELISLSI